VGDFEKISSKQILIITIMTENNRGIIYLVTNTKTGKFYVGQTKEFSGIKTTVKYGIKARWRDHISGAMRNEVGCTELYKAIREHQPEDFKQELLFYCKLSDRDDLEKLAIMKYRSNNPKYGYNVCSGGKGVSMVKPESQRESISKSLNNPTKIMNIKQIKSRSGDKHVVGYKVSRDIDGKRQNKDFSDSKFSLEENLALAQKYLEDLKLGINVDIKHKKPDGLPVYVRYYYIPKTKEIGGYKVEIKKKDAYFSKAFTKKSISMEEKLRLAVEYKDEILEKLSKNQ
jgi:hypothetical protein